MQSLLTVQCVNGATVEITVSPTRRLRAGSSGVDVQDKRE